MISLGNDVKIKLTDWNRALSRSTTSRFVTEVLRSVYSPTELATRSIAGDPKCKTPNGVHSRTQITPKKHQAIRSK